MRTTARGLILFGFAFSSVLSTAEVSKLPPKDIVKVSESNNTKREVKLGKSQEIDHGLEKRSAEVYPAGEPAKKKEYEPLGGLDPDKRARMGFTGMRGKKEFSPDDYCGRILRAGAYPSAYKRFLKSYGGLLGGKRAPLAFHGMRGKKSEDYDDEAADYPGPAFLVDSGLMDGPGPEEEGSDEGGGGFGKRSPYAFQGMRGKKDADLEAKRAMGFLGMRGKKATEAWEADANYKRAPQTSFFGMKGKKAQGSGFFGMRGKKASPNTFYGIKGKREPLDYDFQDFSSLSQMKESADSPSTRFRRGIVWLNNSKKAKNSFFGMRGKKSTEERSDSRLSSTFE